MNIVQILVSQMKLISFTGSFIWLGILLGIFTCIVLYKNKRYLEISFIYISLGSYLYSILLKSIFQFPRPTTASITPYILDVYSFPSSHVVTYTTIFGFLYYVLGKKIIKDRLLTLTLRITFGYLVMLVGLSRVVLGQHYVRDVIFGYCFGLVYLVTLILLYNRLRDAMAKYKHDD